LFQEEQENNTELVRLLDEFKDKTENLRQDYSNLNVKLDQSINSEELYMKQAKDLSEKCVLYSNQLFYSSQKVVKYYLLMKE
jgi:hypothetical protein